MNPLLLVDYYKINHKFMYLENMTKLYSNLTPRKSRIKGIDKVVVFGVQHFIKEYLIDKFNKDFFDVNKQTIINEYQKHCPVDTKHIEELWDLGYLPIEIKSLEEGNFCPIGVPMLTVTNTHPNFGWLVNYLETLISCELWQPITSATISYEYKKLLSKYALETTGSTEGVQWQAHDFSMRGMSSSESAILSGMGHLTSFTGTDVIPAIYQLEKSYSVTGLIGASVPALEHSVTTFSILNAYKTLGNMVEAEKVTLLSMLEKYPTGILSYVADSFDLWSVITEILPAIKGQILARDGKLVIRPDSGNPVDILCGYTWNELSVNFTSKDLDKVLGSNEVIKYRGKYYLNPWDWLTNKSSGEVDHEIEITETAVKGVIELLWDVFGGTVNEQGYKVLDPHIGCIFGDAITLERAEQICERLKAKGFASTNIIFGVGSYTFQYNTRDTFGFAMKATYGEVTTDVVNEVGGKSSLTEAVEIFKDPITDDGTKKSKKGLLRVSEDLVEGKIIVVDQCTWEEEKTGLLTTVFKDGKLVKTTTLEEIRNRLK